MKSVSMENPESIPLNATQQNETHSVARLLIIAGIALAIPLAFFLLSHLTGARQGSWQSSWQSYTLYLPFVAALLTLTIGARHLSRQHYTRAIRCLGLAIVQGVAALVLSILIGWTIS
jgi:hypothetical protein